jgi:hypothetical protein
MLLQEMGSLLFSSWTITPNTNASGKKLKYKDTLIFQYYLEVVVKGLIFLLLISQIKIRLIIVILDKVTNFRND